MNKILLFLSIVFLGACTNRDNSSPSYVLQSDHSRTATVDSSYARGITYLSVYSQIYQRTEDRTYDLTVMASMRNTSIKDTMYIINANYYATDGVLLTSYLESPIYIAPMETVEIIIDEEDKRGGTGANFVFSWACKSAKQEPFFEGVMTSTTGQQGLSFITNGSRIE